MLALKRGPSASRGSRTSTATSTPRSARTCSMMPSENGSAAPAASKSERSRCVIASRPSRRRSSRESAIPSRRALATGTSSYTRPKISCGRTPSSTSRAASRSASPVTLEYEKRPVSVTSPTYSAWRTTSSSGAPEAVQEAAHHHGAARRRRIDDRGRPVARVVVVVVDVDDDREGRELLLREPGARRRAAVQGQQQALAPVGGQLAHELDLAVEPVVLLRQLRRARQERDRVPAAALQRARGRHERADRIAVGVLVRRDEEPGRVPHEGDGRGVGAFEVGRVLLAVTAPPPPRGAAPRCAGPAPGSDRGRSAAPACGAGAARR